MRPHQKASSYSLWLIPAGEVRQQLAKTIFDLSREYAAPAFEPHVTLAGGIVGPTREVAAKIEQQRLFEFRKRAPQQQRVHPGMVIGLLDALHQQGHAFARPGRSPEQAVAGNGGVKLLLLRKRLVGQLPVDSFGVLAAFA